MAQPGAMSYVQSFGSSPTLVAYPHIDIGAPATLDFNYPIGKRWISTALNAVYVLTSITTAGNVKSANWQQLSLSGGAGSFTTITTTGLITSGGGFSASTGNFTATNGNLSLNTPGNKITIATGANASLGRSVAMTAGVVTIATSALTVSSIIFATAATAGGTQGTLRVDPADYIVGVSFVIRSSSGTDTSTVNWWIVN